MSGSLGLGKMETQISIVSRAPKRYNRNWWVWDNSWQAPLTWGPQGQQIMGPRTSWETEEGVTTKYSKMLVKEGDKTYHSPFFDKFKEVAAQLGFDPMLATKIFAITNDKMLSNFGNYRDMLASKHLTSPQLFKKDWRREVPPLENTEQRGSFSDWHSTYRSKFTWNQKSPLPQFEKPAVIPMIQGTNEAAVWKICLQGFGVVGTTDGSDEPGFYGNGVYFTSKLGYADKYAKSGTDGTKPFLVSMVIPGNTFPVVEHPFVDPPVYEKDKKGNLVRKANSDGYKGKACLAGYQSHFTLVDGRDKSTAYPITGAINSDTADEMVTFEGAQALPIFVFYAK